MTGTNKFSVTITNNTFSIANFSCDLSDLVLSGVSGITVSAVSPSSVTLNPGQSQLVEYSLVGTPTSSGTLTATWTKASLNCVKTVAVIQPAIVSLDCSGASSSGTLTLNSVASNVTSVINYSGGNGSAHSGQIVSSTGVLGLTATLSAGNFANGVGSLTYTITGTPSSSGTASFAINIGGESCTLFRTVAGAILIPTTITLAQNTNYFIASVFDQDYWPYTAPTGAASSDVQAADGTNETLTINIQGVVTTIGKTVKIPVTATGSGILPAFSTAINIPSGLTEDNISRDVTLAWTSQAYTSGTTSIDATIATVTNVLNIKKLDINSGIGNDALGIVLGTFSYPYNNAGNTTSFQLRDISVIPDRMYGQVDLGGIQRHNFLYVPVVVEDGTIWLNNNLGASYSNFDDLTNFNPVQQAISATDYKAYGSLFQWGRKADGHELMAWSNSSTGTGTATVMGPLTEPLSTPFFITTINPSQDWRNPSAMSLWETKDALNNPCPSGYRVPTIDDFYNLRTSGNITNGAKAANSKLKLSLAGSRMYDTGSFLYTGTAGSYWMNAPILNDMNTNGMYFSSTTAAVLTLQRGKGSSVRCILN